MINIYHFGNPTGLHKFWEPEDFRGQVMKWIFLVLPVLLSIFLFLHQIEKIQSYENACRNPVTVLAQKQAVPYRTDFSGSTYYNILLSYEYKGKRYSGIYYHYSKSPSALWQETGTLEVAIDPEHPEILVRHMLPTASMEFTLALWTIGISMTGYALALCLPGFRDWRIRAANKPDFLSRPYGKPKPQVSRPDYLKDSALLMIPVFFITYLILSLIFPFTF